jgi:excisionase family DNA binding protein
MNSSHTNNLTQGGPERVKRLYSIKETAESLGLSRSTLYGYCQSGDLNFIKIGERRLIEASEIDAFIQRMRSATINQAQTKANGRFGRDSKNG